MARTVEINATGDYVDLGPALLAIPIGKVNGVDYYSVDRGGHYDILVMGKLMDINGYAWVAGSGWGYDAVRLDLHNRGKKVISLPPFVVKYPKVENFDFLPQSLEEANKKMKLDLERVGNCWRTYINPSHISH